MSLTVENIVAKFPVKTLPQIHGEPDYESIKAIQDILYGNAASLPTTLGGGNHGHIGLIMTPALYLTLSATAYVEPADPGPPPVVATNAAGGTRDNAIRVHNESRRIHDNNVNMDAALKSQIIDAIEHAYICELQNRYTGYMSVSTRDLLDHLLDRYGQISAADNAKNQALMQAPLDTSLPMTLFFKRVEDCKAYAEDGAVPYTDNQVLQVAYNHINATGLYMDACKEWRRKQPADKTWLNFKTFFAAEYQEMKEQGKLTGNSGNYHTANAVTDITNALDQLANAATSDREIVAELTKANTQLAASNKILTDQLKISIESNHMLLTQTNQPATKTPNNKPNSYCWTHGYCWGRHSSKTCYKRAPGHNDAATKDDMQGGATTTMPVPK